MIHYLYLVINFLLMNYYPVMTLTSLLTQIFLQWHYSVTLLGHFYLIIKIQ